MRRRSKTGELRPTGLGLGGVPPGTHICCFFQTHSDLLELMISFLKAGLEAKERCFWVTPPLAPSEAKEALQSHVGRHFERDVDFLTFNPWYNQDGLFAPDEALLWWIERRMTAERQGYVGLRWCDTIDIEDERQKADYPIMERTLDEAMERSRMIILCTYPMASIQGLDLLHLADTHHYILGRAEGRWVELHKRTRPAEALGTPAAMLARAVRSRRLRLMISQEELAERADLHRTYVTDIERGVRNPTLSVMNKLAGALQTTLGELLSHDSP